ncbi:MAG: hypothetical protein QXK98_06260 [Candidatus Bathyarchaeia archaeon]
MTLLVESVRDMAYEKRVIDDTLPFSTTGTSWSSVPRSYTVSVESSDQAVVIAVTAEFPANGGRLRVYASTDTYGRRFVFAMKGQNETKTTGTIACLPVGSHSLTVQLCSVTSGETTKMTRFCVGLFKLKDKATHLYENGYRITAYNTQEITRSITLPTKRKLPFGKTSKMHVFANIIVDSGETCDVSQTNRNSEFALYTGSYTAVGERINESTLLPGKTLWKATVWLKRYGSPTGTLYVRVRDPSNNSIIATLGSYNIASISTAGTTYTFEISSYVNLGTRTTIYLTVECSFTSSNSSNYVAVGYYNAENYINGYLIYATDPNSGWTSNTSYELYFTFNCAYANVSFTDYASDSLIVDVYTSLDQLNWTQANWIEKHSHGSGYGSNMGLAGDITIPLSETSTTTFYLKVSIYNSGSTNKYYAVRIHVYCSVWLAFSSFGQAASTVELSLPFLSTIYITLEPLFNESSGKAVALAKPKAANFNADKYAEATGSGIIRLEYTFDKFEPWSDMLVWYGWGSAVSFIGADIRG